MLRRGGVTCAISYATCLTQSRNAVALQVAEKIAQRNSAFSNGTGQLRLGLPAFFYCYLLLSEGPYRREIAFRVRVSYFRAV